LLEPAAALLVLVRDPGPERVLLRGGCLLGGERGGIEAGSGAELAVLVGVRVGADLVEDVVDVLDSLGAAEGRRRRRQRDRAGASWACRTALRPGVRGGGAAQRRLGPRDPLGGGLARGGGGVTLSFGYYDLNRGVMIKGQTKLIGSRDMRGNWLVWAEIMGFLGCLSTYRCKIKLTSEPDSIQVGCGLNP
jgi:hypothetical protein